LLKHAGSPNLTAVGLPASESPLNPITTFSPTPNATAIALSKVPPVSEIISDNNTWDVGTSADAGVRRATSLSIRMKRLHSRANATSPDYNTRVLDFEGTPLDVSHSAPNDNIIPLESSVD